jgi:polar amino acid transport system substrate-binding protein
MKGNKSMKKTTLLAPVAALALALTSLTGSFTSASAASAACTPSTLKTVTAKTLTIATGAPAYTPWVIDDKPESGKGFEAAVAYAVAKKLGYTNAQVKWIRTSFDSAIAPGPKKFDFNIQQYSITADRAKVVDFSSAYYKSNQAIVTYKGSKLDGVKSIADVKAAKATIGAAVSSTSLDAVQNQLGVKPQVFNDNAAAVTALKNKQIDGLVVDLPTAFYLAAAEVPNGVIAGQFANVDKADKGAGLLLAKNSPITACVTKALDAVRSSGELATITNKWLTASAGAPVLK